MEDWGRICHDHVGLHVKPLALLILLDFAGCLLGLLHLGSWCPEVCRHRAVAVLNHGGIVQLKGVEQFVGLVVESDELRLFAQLNGVCFGE